MPVCIAHLDDVHPTLYTCVVDNDGVVDSDGEPERISWCLGQAGCGAYRFAGFRGQPRPCTQPPRWAGLVLVEHRHPVELWVEYACDLHSSRLQAPRELLDRDRAALDRRRQQHDLGAAGQPYERPGPLATGAAGRHRLRRALALAAPTEARTDSRTAPSS